MLNNVTAQTESGQILQKVSGFIWLMTAPVHTPPNIIIKFIKNLDIG